MRKLKIANLKRLERWESNSIKMLGMIELILGAMLLVPAVIALYCGEDSTLFLYPVPILFALGSFQYLFFSNRDSMSPVIGILMMTAAWIIAFAVSAVPFYAYGLSFVDSLFEGVSGFTTTGATIATDIESMPFSILFWRSFIQWAGGLAVVIIFMFLLPMIGLGGRTFFNNELSGSGFGNFSLRIKSAAWSFIAIYTVLTLAEVLILFTAGVNMFESVCMTFSTISTGGMMVRSDSIAGYSMIVQAVVLVFMLLGGTNFYLHYKALYRRDFRGYLKNQEFVWTVIWFLFATVAISAIVITGIGTDILQIDQSAESIWNTLFTVVSLGTSTGYAVTDYTLWPVAAVAILWVVGIFGAMSGSTSGGIKIYRIMIVKTYISNGMYRIIHPRAVKDVKLDGYSVDKDTITSSIVVILLFLLTGLATIIILFVTEPGMDIINAVGLSMASLSNTGIGFGDYGPAGTFAALTDTSKMFLAFIMWVGRLEIVMALVIFTRAFWKDAFRDMGSSNLGSRIKESETKYDFRRKKNH